MLGCKEENGNIQRSITVTIKPTPTEIADAIWNLSDKEQVTLLGCLKRRFCQRGDGLMQMAVVANELDNVERKKAEDAKLFVTVLADYILNDKKRDNNVLECPSIKTGCDKMYYED